MADTLTPAQRKKTMAAIKGVNTQPELKVRKALHRMGYRFRLHSKQLPGKPDIVMRKYRLCIFVHGCFWHQHQNCKRASIPKTNVKFWQEKLDANVRRDTASMEKLKQLGWNVGVVWECEITTDDTLHAAIERCLNLVGVD